MRKLVLILAFFVAIIALVAVPRSASACMCMPVTAEKALANADVVFIGRVTNIRDGHIEFELVAVWKGRATSTTTLATLASVAPEIKPGFKAVWNSCDFPFHVGEEYVVYARQDPQTQVLTTSICSGTKAKI